MKALCIVCKLYLKLGIIIVMAFVFFICFVYAGNFKYEESSVKLRYVGTNITWTKKTDNHHNLAIPLCIAVGVCGGLSVFIFKRDIFDFKERCAPLKNSSRERRRMLFLSIFLGWIGMDRFFMRKYFTGILKSISFFISFVSAGILVTANLTEGLTAMVALLFAVFLFLFWWTGDIIYIALGAAKTKNGNWLR